MPTKNSRRIVWLTINEVLKLCKQRLPSRSFSAATLYRKQKLKQFPAPKKMVGVNYWRKSEVDAWLTKLVTGK